MKKSIFVLAALVAPSIALAQSQARPISLNDALDQAKRNQPSMIQARGAIRTSAANLRSAKWAFAPTSLGLSYGSSTSGGGRYIDDVLVTQSNGGYNFSQGISLGSVTLFDGGVKLNMVRQRDAQLEQAEVNQVTAEFTVAQQVKQQYYAILAAREQEATAQAQLKQAQQQLAASVGRVRAGTVIHSDSLQSALAVGNARIAILTAQNTINNGNAQLTRLTGSDFPVTAADADSTDLLPLAITDAELFALAENGPTVRSSMAARNTVRAQERSAHSAYWPTVTTGVSYGRNNSDTKYDFGAGKMNYSWSANLGAQLPIWSGFSRENNVLAQKIAMDNADATLRNDKLTVRQTLTQLLGALRVAEQQIVIQRQQIVIAELNLQVVSKRYELGASGQGTLLDVLTAQNSVITARTALSNSRFTVRNTRAQIESLIGRELPQ